MSTRATIPMRPAEPHGPITAFVRFIRAIEAGDYTAAKRFRRALRRFGYSVCPIRPIQLAREPATAGLVAGPSKFKRGQRTASTPPLDRTNALQ
jgi:hypothetical protein